MGYHKNVPWTAVSRERLARRVIQDGVTVRAAAAELSVSVRTAAKWDGRYRPLSAVWMGRPCRSQFAAARSPRQISFSLLERLLPLPALHEALLAQTNGKAERFIQTALRKWAYAKHWTNSQERNLPSALERLLQPRKTPSQPQLKPPISRSDTGATS